MEENPIIPSPRKRKSSNPSSYKGNKIKEARKSGGSYINHKGHEVTPKHPGFTCSCKKQCLLELGDENCVEIFTHFYNIKSKDEQDIFLQGLVDVHEIKRRRARPDNQKHEPRVKHSFSYNILVGTTRKEVCLHALRSVFDISEKRIRRVRELKVAGKTPQDKRGKHISNQVSHELRHSVSDHIRSFPLKESHYSGMKMYYLSADLNIKAMWKLYCEKNTETNVSKAFYYSHYKNNFNYPFGRPQVDTCCRCEELNVKIKSPHLNKVAKRTAVAELLVHKRLSKKFYNALRYENSEEGKKEEDVLSLAFDFMKTISLPRIPIQELYYLRQLSVNVFSVHDIKKNTSKIYLYHEGLGRKGPNEVCTFLNEYLSNVPSSYKKLRLFCDNCSGQNKNQCLSRYCLFLTDSGRFEKVEQYFPVRGHSFLPCDRDFGTISRALRKHDRLFTVHEISEIIIGSAVPGKFEVQEVDGSEILDFKNWHAQHYKINCISAETRGKKYRQDQKVHFSINKLFHFVYESKEKGYIKAFTSVNGLIRHTFFMAKTHGTVPPPHAKPYPTGKVPLKQAKRDDLIKLRNYIPHKYEMYYQDIFQWPTSDLPGRCQGDSDFEDEL